LTQRSDSHRAINRDVGRAIHRYDMIDDADRILVGLSGGKDSLTLMRVLTERLRRIPIRYELFGVYVDPGFEGGFADDLERHCRKHGYRLRIERTDFGVEAHGPSNRENPCFLCSWKRKKRLFEVADELGCRKIALGHHKDDIIETLFLNMCYAGEISTMVPSQRFFDGLFTVIRPLAFVDEDTIRRFAAEEGFPAFVNPCPSSTKSKRSEIKALLQRLYRSNRKIKGNLFRAMHHVNTDYLLH